MTEEMYKPLLSAQQLEELEKLAALNFSPEEMAVYFGVDADAFLREASDPDSPISFHIRRGRILSEAQMQMGLLEDAKKGNTEAINTINKIKRDRSFQASKIDVFGAFENKEHLENIRRYLLDGDFNTLSSDERLYLDTLLMIVNFSRLSGRRNTVKLLTKEPFNCTYAKASDMYDEAINLFYADRGLTKKALRNKYAELLDDLVLQGQKNASTVKDLEVLASITMKAATLRELDKEDVPVLDAEVYKKDIRLFSLDASVVGQKINRLELARMIDGLSLPETDKARLRRDARLSDAEILFNEVLSDAKKESESGEE